MVPNRLKLGGLSRDDHAESEWGGGLLVVMRRSFPTFGLPCPRSKQWEMISFFHFHFQKCCLSCSKIKFLVFKDTDAESQVTHKK